MSRTKYSNVAPLILRRIRAVTGLLLLLYVTSHLINVSFGLISIDAMDAASPYLSKPWSTGFPGVILITALVLHFAVGLWSIYRRPRLLTNAQDIVQMISGLLIVPLLATHALGIYMGQKAGFAFGYRQTLTLFWVVVPTYGLLQVMVVSVVWVHGCAGLLTWLRGMPSARHLLGWIYPLAVLIPVIALLGFAAAGRDVLAAAQNGEVANILAPAKVGVAGRQADLSGVVALTSWVIWISGALGLATLALRWFRLSLQRKQPVHLHRPERATIETSSQFDLLSTLTKNHEPHAHLCAGRGRCGTCAVRVLSHEFPLPEPSLLEQRTLLRINAGHDVRLACQLKADGGEIEVEAVYPPNFTFSDEHTQAQTVPQPPKEATP